jgi:hypothetical protein
MGIRAFPTIMAAMPTLPPSSNALLPVLPIPIAPGIKQMGKISAIFSPSRPIPSTKSAAMFPAQTLCSMTDAASYDFLFGLMLRCNAWLVKGAAKVVATSRGFDQYTCTKDSEHSSGQLRPYHIHILWEHLG